jgi:hypothetical protein
MRALLVSSAGGVLLDVLALKPWWIHHDVVWAAVPAVDTAAELAGQSVYWVSETSTRHPAGLLSGIATAWRIVQAERPDVVVSAGTGCAVPFFLVATVLRVPTVWLSTFNVLTTPGLAGSICGRLASLVLVQRPETLAVYPRGVVIGELY